MSPCRYVAAQQTPFKAINLLLAAFFILSLSFLLPRVDNGDSLRTIVATAAEAEAAAAAAAATAAGVRLGPADRHDGETPFGASKNHMRD